MPKNVFVVSDPEFHLGLNGPKFIFGLDTTVRIPNTCSEWFYFSERWIVRFSPRPQLFLGPSAGSIGPYVILQNKNTYFFTPDPYLRWFLYPKIFLQLRTWVKSRTWWKSIMHHPEKQNLSWEYLLKPQNCCIEHFFQKCHPFEIFYHPAFFYTPCI